MPRCLLITCLSQTPQASDVIRSSGEQPAVPEPQYALPHISLQMFRSDTLFAIHMNLEIRQQLFEDLAIALPPSEVQELNIWGG